MRCFSCSLVLKSSLSLSWQLFDLSVAVIAITTFARWLTVGWPINLTEKSMNLPAGSWKVLTWGGLRGGISRCLGIVHSGRISPGDVILALTYGVVVFSMLGQGLTIGRVIEKSIGATNNYEKHEEYAPTRNPTTPNFRSS